MANTFYGPLDAHIAIPAPQCMSGGTMNFNFSSGSGSGSGQPNDGGPGFHRQLVPFSTVPFAPDPDFVDRPDILGWLREKCAGDGSRVALVGLGGVGKSQLAIQFAHSIHDANPQTFVFWVHASSRTQFEKAYREIAERLQLPERSDPNANVLMLVSNWLRDKANGNWLMVLDNVDRVDTFSPSRKRQLEEADTDMPASLATYIPQSRNGTILVTSRNRDAVAELVSPNRIKEVLAMNEGEGLQLLRNKLCQPPLEESAANLLVALGHIPLAITQAAAYINRRVRMSVTEYLNDFHRNSKKRERLLNWDPGDLRRDESASNSILTTWQLSFEQIQQERPPAAELLSLMSFFNPQGIPEWILRKSRRTSIEQADGRRFNHDEDDEDEDREFDEDLDILRAYSLISATAENNTYEMHPLVQFCMRAWLSSFNEVDQWHHRFVVLTARELPSGDYYEEWVKFRQLFPHIEPLFDSTPAKESLEAWVKTLRNSTWWFIKKGRYTTAQKIAEKALSVTGHALGFNDFRTLDIARLLMTVLECLEKLQEAEKLGQRMLQEYKKEPGKRNLIILMIMGRLATLMQRQGKHDESKKLVQEIIEEHKKVNEPLMIGQLAQVFQKLGQLEMSEKVYRHAIEISKKQPGGHHPYTSSHISHLVGVLLTQGNWLEAEKLLRQTLEEYKEQLGEHHFSTLKFIYGLAMIFESQGRLMEAEKLYWQAVEGFEELGEYNNTTNFAMFRLVRMLTVQRKHEEAAKLLRQVWERQKDIDEHSTITIWCAHSLARHLRNIGQYKEAAELYQQACTGYTAQYGPQHSRTIKCYGQLAALQNKMQQAGSGEGTVSTQPTQDTSLDSDLQG